MRCKSALLSLMFPGLLIALPLLGAWLWAPQPNFLSPLFPTVTALLFVAAVMICWRFGHSRLLLLCVLVVVHGSIITWAAEIYPGWRLMFPLNLLALACVGERPVLSLPMLYRLAMILIQPVVLYALVTWMFPSYQWLVSWQWQISLPLSSGHVVVTLHSAAVAAVAVVLVVKTLWRPAMDTSVMVWALVLVCAAQLSDVQAVFQPIMLYGVLGVILLVSVLERSYALAFRDELTGLPSRRAFLDQVNRRAAGYSLAIVDIDHFKKVNDTHGHDVGDQVLKLVASRLAALSRGGKAFRYGGEEFVLLFYYRDSEKSEEVVERLRQEVSDTPFVLRQQPRPVRKPRRIVSTVSRQQGLRVTVSIGLAQWQKGLDLDAVIKKADQALYKAKKSGRNRVVKA